MTLYSIINAWIDTIELLPHCIDNHLKFCDGVIVVFSRTSNHFVGDNGQIADFIDKYPRGRPVVFELCEPVKGLTPLANETRKRNHGIGYAKNRCTHFFLADSDEFYKPEEVKEVKNLFTDPHLNGVVCPLVVYIGKPTLWCEDHTLVPFIHKLNKNTQAGNFKSYPHAYDSAGHAHIDPSRRLNETRGVVMCNATMHHFSYLRKDIDLKINNSSAKLSRSEAIIKRDIANAKPGYFSELYSKHLKESENFFEIHV